MPGPLQIATPSGREVVITREFDAPRDLVFDCHTKPDLVRRWLLGPPGWTMPGPASSWAARSTTSPRWWGPATRSLPRQATRPPM